MHKEKLALTLMAASGTSIPFDLLNFQRQAAGIQRQAHWKVRIDQSTR